LRSLRQRLIDLEPRPIEMSLTTNSTTSTPQPSRSNHLDCALLNDTEPETPKPADLAVLGLRPHDYFTVTRSMSTLTAAAARNGVLGRVDAHLNEVSLAFPTKSDEPPTLRRAAHLQARTD
jgi:hypothetical protein